MITAIAVGGAILFGSLGCGVILYLLVADILRQKGKPACQPK